ncbi:hypothetical protein BBJ29_010062, partial [Phytophthora kernoviae]
MKVACAIAAASVPLLFVFGDEANNHVERKLILGGETVPAGTKTYTVGLRMFEDSNDFCGGALISPTHVLSASQCNGFGDIRWVSVGSHYYNGTDDGEQIKVVAIMNHPDFAEGSSDYMVLELENATSFQPVKLAAADDSDIKQGEWATTMGWGSMVENGTQAEELQRLNVELWSNDNCSRTLNINNTMVCAGGIEDEDACSGDTGGPLIIESSCGDDSKDVLIGLTSWGYGCGRGHPGVYSRVSYARSWIDPIIS